MNGPDRCSSDSQDQVTAAAVRVARERIKRFVHRTPVLESATLNRLCHAALYLKCENLQRTGAFKARGAFNAVLTLSESQLSRGVVTSSSGNQAAALSLAAKTLSAKAYVVMPKAASKAKIEAVRRYGGEIVWVNSQHRVPTSEEYERAVARICQDTGASPIHPYNDVRTIAGQGTCALEFLEQVPQLDYLLAPVGGGGLCAGTALSANAVSPRVKVIGCEPQMANDAQRSLQAGQLLPQLAPLTIADGLRTSLGHLTYKVISREVESIVTVSEEEIIDSMRLAWEILKIVIEPSAAVPLAVALSGRANLSGKSVGIIVSGGNVDLEDLPWRK